MLDLTPSGLWNEIESAERVLKDQLTSYEDMVTGYHGPAYRPVKSEIGYEPVNWSHRWLSNFLPKLAFDNPRVRLTSKRGKEFHEEVQALEAALNRWIRDTGLRRETEKFAVDYGFVWAAGMVSNGPKPGFEQAEDPQRWPQLTRIPSDRFGGDPLATSTEDCRYTYVKIIRDKEDLLAEARQGGADEGWDLKMVEALTEGDGLDRDMVDREQKHNIDRKEVIYFEVYVGEYWEDAWDETIAESGDNPDDYNGALFTLAYSHTYGKPVSEDRGAGFIRKPRPFYGPRGGPHHIWGAYTVPSRIWPLSPLMVTREQQQNHNDTARANLNSAEQYKKFAAAKGSMAEKLVKARHGTVVAMDEFERASFSEVEIGGAPDNLLLFEDRLHMRVENELGISQTMMGNLGSGVTATADSIAAQQSDTRTAWLVHKFTDGLVVLLKKVLWYLLKDDRIVVELGPDASRELGFEEPVELVGGGNSNVSLDDLELEIEPYSMERTDDGLHQRRVMEGVQLYLQIAPLVAQFPYMNWGKIVEDIGTSLNMPSFGEGIDWEMVEEVTGAIYSDGSEGPQAQMGRQAVGAPLGGPQGQFAPKPGAEMGNLAANGSGAR
jgi:hypothetical protein